MPEKSAGPFEEKVARLEAIVKELEAGTELDRAIALFNEGKTIAAECEKLLKGAQEKIDRATQPPGENEERSDGEIPF